MTTPAVPFGDGWRLWARCAVRGPGFPAAGALDLAAPGLAEAADKFDDGARLQGTAWKEFQAVFADGAVETGARLRSIAAAPAFRAAVAWQNRRVLDTGVRPFLASPPQDRTFKNRQREELVAHYWQRFCVKNDTIGFFGPVGWGRWDEAARGVEVRAGAGLVESTTVFFSSWAVDAVARLVNADPALRGRIAPRRVPFVRVADGAATLPGLKPKPLEPELVAVFDRCDGLRPADEVGPAEAIEELVRRRLVTWRLDVPAATHPDRWVRDWLAGAGVGDGPAVALLDTLDRGRERVAAAAADPDALVAALAALEGEFTELAGESAKRDKGANTAPCRSLVYSDCRRSGEVRLGPDVLDSLAPLRPLFTAARWLTWEVARRVMAKVRAVYTGPTDLASFWFACMPVLHGDAKAIAGDVQREFWDRWREVLPPLTGSRVQVSTADIEDKVAELFAAPGPGWSGARYLSPDILFADNGDTVLGELHVGLNTLGNSLFVSQSADPQGLFDATTEDYPEPRLVPLLAKENKAKLSIRVRNVLIRPQDYQVALVDDTADPARERTVRSADVLVEQVGDDLEVVLPDGARFPVVDVFAHVLTTLVIDMFRFPVDGAHTPRITVDRMAVARETWTFDPAALAFADAKDEAQRFVQARWWRAREGLPRFAFLVSPTEPRPYCVDFDNHISVNTLAKSVRRLVRDQPGGRLVFTEMLPTPEQSWLTDDAGNRYTSELRFVAFDAGERG
ncbi:lantibiotic dehydratase [Actinokineospora bangkokensis]|uniref:Lantibiotic dehydratase n=1 Tax=Actinokineospora bangkokensis TaxID=1193682 RepID=A0A1Q9LM09_9PSEU|nr:lantibiotic dehydratase [Actinokineospora bangkokensis]OLR93060.1 lantibiotic dehydratase [Actinokineospora bangkokensis]